MKITKEILDRVESGRKGFTDPCVICGIRFLDCPHHVADTELVFKQVKKMSKTEKGKIRGATPVGVYVDEISRMDGHD